MQTLTVNGIRLQVHVAGQGSPILFVHGFPLDHTMWHAQFDHFAKTHRVIAPDQRGFGGSDATEGTVTMAQLADDMAGLLDALRVAGPVCLCGLSMGGYVGLNFFERHRPRLGTLVLCDSRAGPDTLEGRKARLESADRVLKEGSGFLAESLVARLFSEQSRRMQPAIIKATQDVIRRNPPAGTAAAARGMAERPDMTGMLGDIDVPTLLVVGTEDVISPVAEMRSMAAAIPDATLVEVAGAGHMSPLEAPDTVTAAIEHFLGTV